MNYLYGLLVIIILVIIYNVGVEKRYITSYGDILEGKKNEEIKLEHVKSIINKALSKEPLTFRESDVLGVWLSISTASEHLLRKQFGFNTRTENLGVSLVSDTRTADLVEHLINLKFKEHHELGDKIKKLNIWGRRLPK